MRAQVQEGKSPGYRLTSAHPSKTAKGAAAPVVVVPAQKIKGGPAPNTLTDGSYTYTWNGESEMKTAGGVTYIYDGDGRRAAKVGTKLYWYGSGGDILSGGEMRGG
jgi:hypothetical protein